MLYAFQKCRHQLFSSTRLISIKFSNVSGHFGAPCILSNTLDLRSIRLTVVKVVVSSEGTCNNCLFVEMFNNFLYYSNEIFDFLASNTLFLNFC